MSTEGLYTQIYLINKCVAISIMGPKISDSLLYIKFFNSLIYKMFIKHLLCVPRAENTESLCGTALNSFNPI